MSGKPKKNKAPAAEEPIEEEFPVDDIEEQHVEAADINGASKSTNKGKAPADAKKKKGGRKFRLSSIDPIILASFSVFLVACLIVTGITIYDITAGETSTKAAEYGDSIEVYYTGSYFAYYDEEGAVIFDTDMEEVGEDNEKYKKSYGYTTKEAYSTMQMTVGQGDLLDEFKNALIGHRPGDVVQVKIVDGYGTLTEGVNKFTVLKSNGYRIDKVQTMTVSDYKSFFGVDDAPESGFTFNDVDTPYGWKANVTGITGDMVRVEHLPVAGESYAKNEVTYKVNTIEDIGVPEHPLLVINFEYQMDDFADNAKILKGVYDGQIVYFIKSDGVNMTYKTTDETVGTTMFFTIKFVGYTS